MCGHSPIKTRHLADLMSSSPSSLPALRSVPADSKTPKITLARSASVLVTVLTLVIAIIMLGLCALLVGFAASEPQSPAMFRVAPLVLSAMFSVGVISVWSDEEMFDFWSTLAVGTVALVANVLTSYHELGRLLSSPGSLTALAAIIVDDYPTLRSTAPAVITVITALNVVLLLLLVFWLAARRAYLLALARYTLRQATTAFQTDKQLLREQRQRSLGARAKLFSRAVRNSRRRVLMGLSVAEIVVLAFVALLALFYPDVGAFYRAVYLLPAAFSAAAEYAFFGTTPRGWTLVSLVFASLALLSASFGAVLDVARLVRCVHTSYSPANVVENRVCLQEGWLGYVTPVALVLVVIGSIVQVIYLFKLMSDGRDAIKRKSGD